jgi:outer membrane biosynthesis protein TonB
VNRKVWIVSVISTVAALMLASMAVAFAAQDESGNGQEQTTICHKGHTITVAVPALAAHERHGDTQGECPEDATTAPDDPEDTTPDTTVPETTTPDTTTPDTTTLDTTTPDDPEDTVPDTTVPETTTPDTSADGQEKVTICHKGHTITVGAPAVPSHERHGDIEGACADEEGAGDGAAEAPDVDVPEDAAQTDVVISSSKGQDLYGNSAPNTLRGTTRADFLQSGRGHDAMFGDAGNDYIDGVDGISGNDELDGGRGIDHCVGDEGDTFRYCDGNVVEVPSATPSAR